MSKSSELFARAEKILIGGVNSPVRAFRAVGGTPLIIDRAAGSRLWDADGREYLDFVCSWGALILGHAHPDVVAAIADQASRGTSYGMTSPLEIELGERISRAVPSIERIRFVSSGTEATMSAVRVARAFTKRDLILKFEGGYHGHADSFLVEAGSGLATLGISSSPGVPEALARLTLNAPYNDASAVEKIFAQHSGKIAAVIVEPVAANMGVVPPAPNFLEELRRITQRDGALLLFDEVITGFRLAYGGAQDVFKVQPDITVLGKIIGGGLPVAAYGGRRAIMDMIAPLGPSIRRGRSPEIRSRCAPALPPFPNSSRPAFTPRSTSRLRVSPLVSAAPSTNRACPARSTAPALCSRFSSAALRSATMLAPRSRTRSGSPHSSARCSPKAFCFRPPSLKLSSFPPRIPMPTLTAPSPQREPASTLSPL